MNDEQGHRQTNRAWFHFRLRTVVLSLVGFAMCAWVVHLLMRSEDSDTSDESVVWIGLAFVVYGLVCSYLTRFSRCPKCGKYALGQEGSFLMNLLKLIYSPSGHPNYWNICRNCAYQEWHEVSES
jgi:hypothetical protein